MAFVLEANYSKKLGLPGYSSHQYSVTVRAELSDVTHAKRHPAPLQEEDNGSIKLVIMAA